MKSQHISMIRILIVLAVGIVVSAKKSKRDDSVGMGNSKMRNCMRSNGMGSLSLFMMGMTPQCDGKGRLRPMQCYEHSRQCVCVREDGTVIKQASESIKGCKCVRAKDKEENAGLIGNYIPQCEEDGTFKKKQCHYSTGFCYCADSTTGKNTTVPARGEINCD